MTDDAQRLAFYAEPGPYSSVGRYRSTLRALPGDLRTLVRVVQGLVLHEYVASAYGVTVPEERRFESHLRKVEAMLDRIFELDGRPLTETRPPQKRLVGVCHHPILLLLAILRAKGRPARARCGFGSYFNPGYYEDHWICEVWNEQEKRFQLVDPQFDAVWLKDNELVQHDICDVPRDRFLVAADAWQRCRAQHDDASKFGIFRGNLRGPWFIATDLVHDVAALNKVELLPWDIWGAAPPPTPELNAEQLVYFDRLAELSSDPDASFDELREQYARDAGVHVQDRVFNAILQREDEI